MKVKQKRKVRVLPFCASDVTSSGTQTRVQLKVIHAELQTGAVCETQMSIVTAAKLNQTITYLNKNIRQKKKILGSTPRFKDSTNLVRTEKELADSLSIVRGTNQNKKKENAKVAFLQLMISTQG